MGALSLNVRGEGQDYASPFAAAATNPLLEREDTMSAYRKGEFASAFDSAVQAAAGRPPLPNAPKKDVLITARSGVAVTELCSLTDDPKVRERLLSADSNHDGNISRQDILRLLQSELSAKSRMRFGLAASAVLLVFCVVMLAANAALTYTIVRMGQETRLHSSGKLTDKSGAMVVGTAQSAAVVDLEFAHHTPAEDAAALLSLKELLVNSDGEAIAAYRVLSSRLVPGRQLEFVVAAPGGDDSADVAGLAAEDMDADLADTDVVAAAVAGGSSGSGSGSEGVDAVLVGGASSAGHATASTAAPGAAELVRIVISDAGVHEVRSSSAGGGAAPRRRLLAASGTTAGVQGVAYDVNTGQCEPGATTCPSAANLLGCPLKPTCGANGRLYGGPCEAKAAGTSITCIGCGPTCPGGSQQTGSGTGRPAVVGGINPTDPRFVKTLPDADVGSGLPNPQFRGAPGELLTTTTTATKSASPPAAKTAAPPTTPRKSPPLLKRAAAGNTVARRP